MNVKKINGMPRDAKDIPAWLDKEEIAFQPIHTLNWPAYPYAPNAAFRMVHTGTAILLHFRVTEGSVRARYAADNDRVWTDSCVEFFSSPANDDIYYNLECNCIGTVLLAAGKGRKGREQAPASVLKQIQRWASLGTHAFEEKVGVCTWEVALLIPGSAFFKHTIETFSGKNIRANFYKCGDELEVPHFLSWKPIHTDSPDFHSPEFFGRLSFEV